MHLTTWLLLFALWVPLTSFAAEEQPAPGKQQRQGEGLFGMWDRDADERLTEQELGDKSLFIRWDLDGDGVVTPSEFYRGLGNGLAPKTIEGQEGSSD